MTSNEEVYLRRFAENVESQNSADRVDQWRCSILSATSRIYDPVLKTPMGTVDERDVHVYFKPEYLQRTASFKLRGATNKIFSLDDAQKRAGVVTSSTGNYGLGVATAAKYKGVDAEVFVSSAVGCHQAYTSRRKWRTHPSLRHDSARCRDGSAQTG